MEMKEEERICCHIVAVTITFEPRDVPTKKIILESYGDLREPLFLFFFILHDGEFIFLISCKASVGSVWVIRMSLLLEIICFLQLTEGGVSQRDSLQRQLAVVTVLV